MAANPLNLARRFMTFRKELVTLWRAFLAPDTPLHLKALMLLVPAYLLSPIDIIPDIFPVLGWIDDLVIVPMLVSWITSLLPANRQQTPDATPPRGENGPVIEGTARRR